MTRFRFIVGFIFSCAALLVFLYFLKPDLLVGPLTSLNQSLAGLSKKTIMVEDHQITYLEGGQGPTVVLLHGIFSEKDHFVDFARELTDQYRVIIPDIPAYGESSRLEGSSYDYASQVKRLQKFLDALGVDSYHVAGNSMGGTLGALLSLEHRSRVKSLAFIGAPHGMKTPLPSLMDDLVAQKKAPLIVRSPEEFETMLDRLFFKRPFLPYPILKAAQDSSIRLADDNERIFWRQHEDRFLLHEIFPQISVPLLTIWGENEQIFHPSGAQVIQEQRPDQTVIIMPETGHLPQMERPKITAGHYLQFIPR